MNYSVFFCLLLLAVSGLATAVSIDSGWNTTEGNDTVISDYLVIPPHISNASPGSPNEFFRVQYPSVLINSPNSLTDAPRREFSPPVLDLPIQDWQFPLLSFGISLVILAIMVIAGVTIGGSYRYVASQRAERTLSVCHIISALLIGGMIGFLHTLAQSEQGMNPFIGTLYTFFGILMYLLLSSLIQAISLIKRRPLIPLHQAHILFVVIAIIMVISVRIPVVYSMTITILVITAIIVPGAVFSLITSHFIEKRNDEEKNYENDRTITHQLPIHELEFPSSFPDKLAIKYRDVSVIGSGGMAVVYRAIRSSDGREVALKIPFSADETSGKTFLNEMSVWRDLNHPHIVTILDQNIFPVPYVELEYLPRSLKDITLPVPQVRALAIVRQIGSALLYAHGKGVIHRDIKPGNVLLTEDGTAKLTDWGLSRFIDRGDDTRNTSFSLYYATPEQLSPDRFGNGDERTDIYQLGVLLYELICGYPPYGTQNIGELFTKILQNQYLLPSQVTPELYPFDSVIRLALHADPDERYANIQAFLNDLERIP